MSPLQVQFLLKRSLKPQYMNISVLIFGNIHFERELV